VLYAYLDASALAKRYVVEPGTPVVNHLFARIPAHRLIVLTVGMTEVASILVRKRNAGRITSKAYTQAFLDFAAEIGDPAVDKVAVNDQLATQAFDLVEKHSINATDAILLRSALDLAAPLKAAGHELMVVASDPRLLRAGRAEGLLTFNPETQSAADLDALIGP